jgi:hypothetical protein
LLLLLLQKLLHKWWWWWWWCKWALVWLENGGISRAKLLGCCYCSANNTTTTTSTTMTVNKYSDIPFICLFVLFCWLGCL